MKDDDPLNLFLPPVRAWFGRDSASRRRCNVRVGRVIAAGRSTLLLAPTGSGKTLAAFLACLDGLWRQNPIRRGVQVLYISPLKALNNDIYRNLQVPLHGVATRWPQRSTSSCRRSTSPSAPATRRPPNASVSCARPPHVLITTPESLHLLLTSKARETLRNVTHCIVDEIHALCPNKRGVFLALLLERLAALIAADFVRIGLSATQRPLEEVARYLGGSRTTRTASGANGLSTIVDAGLRKNLDLQVVSPVEHFGPLPEKSIWPSIYRLLAEEIRRHRSTIVFANNRRSVERLTAMLNEILSETDPGRARLPPSHPTTD